MAVLSIGQVWGEVWVKVTAAPTAPATWAGEYLIVYENSATEAYVWTGIDNTSCYTTATISSDVIASKPSGAASVTVTSISGGYSLMVNGGTNDGKYMKNNGNSNGIKFETTAGTTTFTYENSSVTIACGGKKFRYNNQSGNLRFRYFGSAQQVVQLYKKCYTVTYNKNGGTSTMTDSNSPYAPNATVTVLDNAFTAPEGKTFDGWNSKADGSGDDFGASFTITKDTTLYAQWASAICTDKVNITKGTPESGASFNLSKTGEQNCCEALTVNVTGITAPTGKIFKEITQTGIAAGNVTIDNNAKTVTYAAGTSGNSTINVVFDDIPSHSVTWSANGTTNIVSYQEGASITFPATATGCIGGTFMGWAAAEISGTRATAPTYVKSATMGTSDLTYYAVFATASGSGAATYTLVSSADDFEDGTYVVAGLSSDTYYFMNGTAVAKGLGVEETGLATSALTSNSFTAELLPENAIEVEVEDDGDPDGDNHYYFISYTSGENTYFMDDGGSGSDLTWTTNAQVYTYHPNFDAKATAGCCLLSSSGTKVSQNSNTMASWIRNYASSGNYYNDLYFFKKSGGYTYSDYRTSCCTPHAITANGIGGGLVLDPNITEACAGTEITLTASTPDGSHQGIGVIKVVETADPENEITSTVYNSGTGVLTMPDYAITITATYAEKSTPSAAADPAALDFGSPLQGAPVAAQTFSLTGSALEAGTLTLVAPAGFSVSPSEVVIASAGALSAQTITVTPNTENAGNKSGNITISGAGIALATNLVALTMDVQPTYTVNWYVNGSSTPAHSQTAVEGATLTEIPNDFTTVADCSDLTFRGWLTTPLAEASATKPVGLIESTEGMTMPNGGANYYAVFAESESSSETLEFSYTIATTDFNGSGYVANNNEKTRTAECTTDNTKTTEVKWTSYQVMYNNTSGTIRIQGQSNNGKIYNADSWGTIKSITINNNENYTYVIGDEAEPTASATGGFFKISAGSSTSKASSIEIVFDKTITTTTYKNFVTTCPHCNSVSLSKAGQTHGTIALQVNSADVEVVKTCDEVSVNVVATPETGYELTNIALTGTAAAKASYDAGVITIEADADGTLTATATFSQINHTVALEQNPNVGATLTGAKNDAHYGETINISTTIPNGYLFAGWTPAELFATTEAANATSTSFTMPNNSVTVTANILPKVTVTFHVGATTYGEPAETYEGGKISLPAAPTSSFDATNYPNFIGWSATDFGAATSAPALVTGDETINASTDYYAVFANAYTAETNNYKKIAYSSSLDAGNYLLVAVGSTEAKAMKAEIPSNKYNTTSVTVTVGEGDVINNPAAALIWALSKSGDNVKLKNGDNWAQIYNDGNGHTNLILTTTDANNTYEVSQNGSTEAYVFTTTSSVGDNKEIEYYNNEFKPYSSQNTDYPIYLFKQVLAPTKWATKQLDEVTVSFNDNVAEEEITVPGNQVVDSGDDLDLSGFTPGARAGYQFSGWSLTTDGAVVASLSNITEDTPLYAIWAPNHTTTIKFYAINTTTPIETHDLLQGLAYAIPDLSGSLPTAPTGYTFAGWSASQITDEAASYTKVTSVTPPVDVDNNEMPLYAIYKRSVAGTDVTDEITTAQLAATTSQYAEFSNVAISSNARYTGKTSKNNGIQMNATNPNAIVTTTSGGVLKNISIVWNSECVTDRVLDVYVNNSAYTGSADLWGEAAAQGTKVTTFTNNGSTTSYNFTDDYAYIGVRSHQNALNLDKISITWTPMTNYYTSNPKWTVTYTAGEGSGDDVPVQKAADEAFDLAAADLFTAPAGKEFDGWLCNIGEAKYAAGAEYTMTAAATTFTAQWKQITYTVSYAAGEGSGDAPAAVEPKVQGATFNVAENTFTAPDGKVFDKWNDGSADYAPGDTYTVGTSNVVLTAIWKDAPAPAVDWTNGVRTSLTEGYYTMCLEKAVTNVRGASIWRIISKASNGLDIILEEVEGTLDAGRPYIFYATAASLDVVYTGDAVLSPITTGNNGLIGSFEKANIANVNTNYIIYNNELYYVNTNNVYVGDHRAYIDMTAVPNYDSNSQPGNAPRRRVTMHTNAPQTATGIGNVQGDDAQCTKVLINGQMYILRGEKMYDATGKLVK